MKHLLLSIVLASCATSVPERSKGTDTLKPGAPTTLESQVGPGTAKLALKFASAGKDVLVVISGIDGITVTSSAEALTGATVSAGQVVPLDVAFTGTRGHLVVSVRGNFGGSTDARVHSVQIGEVQLQNDGKVMKTDDGDTVKVMP